MTFIMFELSEENKKENLCVCFKSNCQIINRQVSFNNNPTISIFLEVAVIYVKLNS